MIDAEGRLWHPPNKFPTPGVQVLVRLTDGSIAKACRPSYVSSYKSDPNFRDTQDNHILGVEAWCLA